ncbi:Twin-arginine translocation pathway signal [Streptomyces sp. NPDC059003]|uniref:Twin-arginine translocation pathway signal n=1 Tax=Streptomyces sp. NPDC059003 TaxID=3346691 RepID=UPI0036B64B14
MTTMSRTHRYAIRYAAAEIRERCRLEERGVEQVAAAIQAALPTVHPLEAWRLALGWQRPRTIARIAALYRSRGLRPPGLSSAMLCRWEHDADAWPSLDYVEALCAVYQARPDQLGLDRGVRLAVYHPSAGYSASAADACALLAPEMMVTMTTAAGLPAVRESLQLALLAAGTATSAVVDQADEVTEHYALNYSRHAPHVLFEEVYRTRGLLTGALALTPAEPVAAGLRRSAGWLSGLLGNAAFHLEDLSGARVHLTTAATCAERTGDSRLAAWACGAQAMVARAAGHHETALNHAERGLALAPSGLPRAQLQAWAQAPSLAALGRAQEADLALADAARELEADPEGAAPGRYGFDSAEYRLHEAEAQRVSGRTDKAMAAAESSLAACTPGTPGWAAASLTLAQAEALSRPGDAAERALAVLEQHPPARLRSTARARLADLTASLASVDTATVADLRERVRALPPAITIHGTALA